MKEAAHIGHEGAKIAARGAKAVGSSVEVLWHDDDVFYPGKITGYDHTTRSHEITYDEDGVVESGIALWGEKEIIRLLKSSTR